MSDENDILQKADALLRRRASSSEPDFPILTEVVEALPAAHPLPTALGNSRESSTNPPRSITPSDILELERRILEKVLPTIDVRLERLIRSILLPHFREILERTFDVTCKELSCATTTRIAEHLSEVVKVEIQSELSKFRSNISDV